MDANQSRSKKPKRKPAPRTLPLAGVEVFLVDDDSLQLGLLQELLERAGANVVATTNPLAMDEMLRQKKPDVFLTDVIMPKLDGWELFARMRATELNRDTPTLFLTCLTNPADEVHFTQGQGRCRLISKPIKEIELVSAVKQLLVSDNETVE